MGDIYIRNIRTFKTDSSVISVRVDRMSVLGNPFYMNAESDRDLVCDKYTEYFYKKVTEKTDIAFMKELYRLKLLSLHNDIFLICWCSPMRCHAETIQKYLLQCGINDLDEFA